jgi:hypothetical protein
MRKRRIWISVVVALLLAAGGGYVAYNRFFSPSSLAEEPTEPTLETATVTQGDIIITVDGSGELVPVTEQGLTFRTNGVLAEILVEVGDQVQEDEVLARLETDQLERAVAEAEVELGRAKRIWPMPRLTYATPRSVCRSLMSPTERRLTQTSTLPWRPPRPTLIGGWGIIRVRRPSTKKGISAKPSTTGR